MPDELDELLASLPSAPRGTITRTSHLPELTRFAQEKNLVVGSTTGGRHNVGSKHYSGNAIDIKGSGAFDNATVNTLKQEAAARGLLVRDERTHPRGQKVWGGPHIHIEYAGAPQQPKADPLDDLLAGLPDIQAAPDVSELAQAGAQASPQPVAPPVLTRQPTQAPRGAFAGTRSGVREGVPQATNSIYAAAQQRARTGTTVPRAARELDLGLSPRPRQRTEDLITEAIHSPEAETRSQIRKQITDRRARERNVSPRAGMLTGSPAVGNLEAGLKMLQSAMSPVETVTNLFKSEDDLVNEEVDRTREAQLRTQTPEMVAERQEFGRMSAPRRAVSAPAARAGAGLVKALAGVTSGLGIAPNRLSEYLSHRAQVLEEASQMPLDAAGEDVERGRLEKVISAVGDVGFGVAEIIALKKAAPGMSLSQILAVETALKTSDMPIAERTDAVAKSAAMGKVLDQHLSRTASAAVFGVPTAVETGTAYAKGNMSAEDALLQTGVQAGTGFLMGGKPSEIGRRGNAERVIESYADSTHVNTTRVVRRVGDLPDSGMEIPQRFAHKDFGEVTASENQSGVSRGSIRVVDQAGAEHTILRPKGTGAGNIRAIPIKEPTEPARIETPEPDALDQLLQDVPSVNAAQPSRGVPTRGEIAEQKGVANVAPASEKQPSQVADTSTLSGEGAAPVGAAPDLTRPRVRLLEGGARPKIRVLNEPRGPELPILRRGPSVSELPVLRREPSKTSARKEMFAADRAELDLPELPAPERKAWQKTLDEAKARGTQNAGVLADEVLAKPRALNDVETGQLVLRAQEIKNSHSQVMKEIGATTDRDVISTKREQADALQREFDRITEATKKSGTEKGRALASQKLTINQDFDLVSVMQRAKAARGRELRPEERQKIEAQTKQIEELQTKLVEAESKVVSRRLQSDIDKIVRKGRRADTKAALDDEFVSLKSLLAQAKLEIKESPIEYRQGGIGLASLDPSGKLTPIIAKMARNRVRAGTVKAEALVDEIYTAVKEHVEGITRRDVRDAISGYGLSEKRTRSELEKELDRLKSEMYSQSSIEDIEAGKRSPRREGPSRREQAGPIAGPRKTDAYRLPMAGPRRSDIQRVPLQGPRMSEAARSGVPLQGPRLSDAQRLKAEGPRIQEAPFVGPRRSDVNRMRAEGPRTTDAPKLGPRDIAPAMRKRLQDQATEIERKIREKDYSEPPKRGPIVYDRETSNLKARVEQLKRQIDADIRGTDSKLDVILALRKAGMLTGVRTHMRNVGGTGAFQAFEEAARVPGALADLLTSAVTGRRALGAPDPIAVAKSSYTAATKGITEAKQILKYGATAEDLAKFERPREMNSGNKLLDRYVNTVFRTLGAEDKIFRTYAFKRSIEDQARLRSKELGKSAKELAENPTADMVAQAALDAEVATFNNENKLATRLSPESKIGKTAMDLILPFKRTPANVFARLLESSPLGLAKPGWRVITGGVNKKMSFEDQRKFSQTIGRSVTGSGLIALGYWLAGQGLATGLTEDDAGDREVQKASGRSPLSVKVGDNWHQIGAFSPIGNLVAVGAAMHRERTRPLKEGEERGNIATSAVPVAAKVMLEQPFLRGASGVVEAIKEPGSRGSALIGQTIGSFVPTIVSDVGATADNTRRQKRGIIDRIQERVPILRRKLPEDVDVFARPLQSRRTALIDPTLTAKDVDDPFIKELVRLDVGIVKANRKPGEDELKHRERVIAQGKEMAKELATLTATRGYIAASDDDKREMIKNRVEQVRKAVNNWIETGGRRQPREARKPRQVPYRYVAPN